LEEESAREDLGKRRRDVIWKEEGAPKCEEHAPKWEERAGEERQYFVYINFQERGKKENFSHKLYFAKVFY